MQNWHLIQQPLLRRIFKYPPIFSYKRGRSLNKEVTQFIEQANTLTIKFTAEVSDTETTFLDTKMFTKAKDLHNSLDQTLKLISKRLKDFSTRISRVATHRLTKRASAKYSDSQLETNSSETAFKTAISQIKTNLIERGYPETLVSTTLTEITFEERKPALQQKRKQDMQILPFVTQHRPSVPDLKQILMQNWHLIQQQQLLTRIFKYPPIFSYKMGRSLIDIYSLEESFNWLLHVIVRPCRPIVIT